MTAGYACKEGIFEWITITTLILIKIYSRRFNLLHKLSPHPRSQYTSSHINSLRFSLYTNSRCSLNIWSSSRTRLIKRSPSMIL